MTKLNPMMMVVAVTLFSLFSQPALSDYEVMHGSICHYRNPDDKNYITYLNGGVSNRDTVGARQVVCPLAAGHEFKYDPEEMFIDHVSTVAFTCTFRHFKEFRLVQSITATIPAAPAGAARAFPGIAGITPNALSSFELVCNLPANNAARIVAIETII